MTKYSESWSNLQSSYQVFHNYLTFIQMDFQVDVTMI